MQPRIYRVVLLTVVLAGLLAGTAQAAPTPVLHEPLTRHVMALYLTEQQELGHDQGWGIENCLRYNSELIFCHVVEYEIEWPGIGIGDLYYRLKAKREGDGVRLLASLWGDLHFVYRLP